MLFRQLFDAPSSTYSYLLADRGEAVVVDPVLEQAERDAAFVRELGLKLLWTLETHVHADHVTGAWFLKQRTASKIAIAAESGAHSADRFLRDGDRVSFGGRHLDVQATPGHTQGCVTYVLDDRSVAFTGDCLLIRGCGRTDFQGGDAAALYRSVHERIFTLPDDCLLYPAHDYRGLTVTTVGEEKAHNPRLGGDRSEGDFVGYMRNLGLAHPKKIDIAVPANLRCGRPDEGETVMTGADWGPLSRSAAGVPEVDPAWVEANASAIQVLDVREPAEYTGELSHIAGATLIPLGQLAARAGELSKERPVVAVCRSGARSAQATNILRQAGFEKVANLPGGMLRWRADRRAVEGR